MNDIQNFEERQNEMLAQLQKLVSQLQTPAQETEVAKRQEKPISAKIEDSSAQPKTMVASTKNEKSEIKKAAFNEKVTTKSTQQNAFISPMHLDEKSTGEATSLVEKVMMIMKDRIAALNLSAGTRLPSIRRLATTMGVSKSTVVEAYNRLEQQGVIQARRGSGFFVAKRSHFTLIIRPQSDNPRNSKKLFNKFEHIAQLLNSSANMPADIIAAGADTLPADLLPLEQVSYALSDLAKDKMESFSHYNDPQILACLRSTLSQRFSSPAINIAADNLLITDSVSQSLDLACRYLLQAGDTVLVDDPCSFVFLNMLQAHRVKAIAVPFTSHGPDLDFFAKAAAAHHPRLYITNAGFQDPTGANITPVHAHRLLTIAEQHNITLIEDHSYAELDFTETPYLSELDGLNRTIRIGDFSKSISPAIRTGFIAAKETIISDLINLKLSTILTTNTPSAYVVNSILQTEQYSKNRIAINKRLKESFAKTKIALQKTGLIIDGENNSGLFIWAELPNEINASDLTLKALDENILLAPGELFSENKYHHKYLRFNTSRTNNEKLFSFLQRSIKQTLS